MPVRIALGTHGLLLGALTAPRFVALFPQAERHPVPGVGHVPMADDSQLAASAILDFAAVGAGAD